MNACASIAPRSFLHLREVGQVVPLCQMIGKELCVSEWYSWSAHTNIISLSFPYLQHVGQVEPLGQMGGDGGFADAWNASNEYNEGDAVVDEPEEKGGRREEGGGRSEVKRVREGRRRRGRKREWEGG